MAKAYAVRLRQGGDLGGRCGRTLGNAVGWY